MLEIAVYDDDRRFAAAMERTIREVNGWESGINTGGTADMLRYVERADSPVLFFLDILDEGQQPAGFELADRICAAGRGHLIVFLTQYPCRIIGNPPYLTKAFSTIFKQSPNVDREVAATIRLAREVVARRCLLIRAGRSEHLYIPFQSICYLERVKGSNRVRIHCEDGEYHVKDSLVNLHERLDERFVRCHNSCIANRDNIRRIDKHARTVHFHDGSSCVYALVRKGELGL